MKIYKYTLETTDVQEIPMPEGAEILTVQMQFDEPQLWALVNPDNPPVTRVIETIGTGNPIREAERNYIGTYQLQGGRLVFHVFEQLKNQEG
jgi:hypothetical protein